MFVNICVDPAITCKAMHRCRRNGGKKNGKFICTKVLTWRL